MSAVLRFVAALLPNIALILGLAACSSKPESFPQALQQRLAQIEPGLNVQQDIGALRTLYAERGGTPLWRQARRPTPQALALMQDLNGADAYGLRPADYDAAQLRQQLQALQTSPDAAAQRWADFDVDFSLALLRFLKHLHYGRIDPDKAGLHLDRPRPRLDLAASLGRLAATNDLTAALANLEPRFHQYRWLKTALARYRQLAAQNSFEALPGIGERPIKPGERYAGAGALRQRLAAFGDAPAEIAAVDSEVLDPALTEALQNFQQRHGITADGVLGRRTLAALNSTPAQRVRQIELTLERWRWLPESDAPSIIVNVPQFRLFAFESNDDKIDALNMEVVVGQTLEATRTPIFLDEMQYLVFRPYWDVPYNLMQREMLPAIVKDPKYLEQNHLELVRGRGDDAPIVPPTPDNIAALAGGEVRLRQIPGPDNALGAIKFMLPNQYNVYLHSTPAQELFKQPRRAFSHGCIRVSNPTALAAYVMRGTPGDWTEEKIQAAMEGKPNQRVTLAKPIRVMILYNTAVATESGPVYFFDDIYGEDLKLEELLEK